MKPSSLKSARIPFTLASAIAALLAAHSVKGQTTRYWDNNGSTGGFGSAGGTWAAPTVSQWTTVAAGNVAPGASITTLINDPLHFGTDTAGQGLGGGTITVSGTVDAASLRFGNQTTASVTLSGGTINLAAVSSIHVGAGGTTNHNITSSITGAATSLTKTGNLLTLSGANSYTGSTIISAGTLSLNNATALGGNNPGVNGTSGIQMTAGTTLRSAFTGGTTNVYAPITLGAAGNYNFVIAGGSSSTTVLWDLNGAIGGGAGTNVVYNTITSSLNNSFPVVTLNAAGTYQGTTSITTGNTNNNLTVKAGVGIVNALPSTTVLTLDGGNGSNTSSGRVAAYDLNGNNQTLAGLTNSTSGHATSRNQRVSNGGALATLTINNTADFSYGGQTTDAEGTGNAQITGAIALTKNGAGTFTLGGALGGTATTANAAGNSFTGDTKILGGILVLGVTNAIRNSAFDTANSIAGNLTNGLRTSVTTLTMGGLTGGNDFSTRFTTTTGGYTGLTDLTLNPGTGVTNTYSANIGDGATGMNLNKTGAGTQILSGTNSHTGSTNVSVGTLVINGSLANTSTTIVSGTGTLKGSGTVNSSVTINSGGTLASGNSIESLIVGGNLSHTTGSNFQYELDADVAEKGDLTAVSGSLSLTGTVNLNFIETGSGLWQLGNPVGDHLSGSPPADKLTLIAYNGTWNGGLFTYLGNIVPDNSPIILNGRQWWFRYNDTDAGDNFTGDLGAATRFVTMTVPEPSTVLLGGLGLLALLRRRR